MIYFIDDEHHGLKWLIYTLRSEGFEAVTIEADTASEAYLALLETPRSLDDYVIIDLMIPAGFELPDSPDFFCLGDERAGVRLAQALLELDRSRFSGRLAILTAAYHVGSEAQSWLELEGIPVLRKDRVGELLFEIIMLVNQARTGRADS